MFNTSAKPGLSDFKDLSTGTDEEKVRPKKERERERKLGRRTEVEPKFMLYYCSEAILEKHCLWITLMDRCTWLNWMSPELFSFLSLKEG